MDLLQIHFTREKQRPIRNNSRRVRVEGSADTTLERHMQPTKKTVLWHCVRLRALGRSGARVVPRDGPRPAVRDKVHPERAAPIWVADAVDLLGGDDNRVQASERQADVALEEELGRQRQSRLKGDSRFERSAQRTSAMVLGTSSKLNVASRSGRSVRTK